MASANMVSASAPAISKAALGQTATASGNSSLGKSSFTGACIPVSSRRVARRAERRVCMSAAKDETHKIAAPLRKGLAAGLLAATIATSSGPAYADDAIAKVEQRWGQITQKARKATSEAKSTFSPAIDSLNKKNTLAETTANKIPQRSKPSFGAKKNDGTSRVNVSFTEAPPLRFVGLDTKGTPADPETVKDDAIGGITDPASIPGRIKERAGTIASKLPNLPSIDQAVPGNKGIKDIAPDLVEGSSEKIPQRSAPSFGTGKQSGQNVSFSQAVPLRYVGLDTKGTPADPETVKDDAIGGITDPASIPGRVKERAETIASKLPSLPSLPSLGGADTKGTPADPETVKDDAIGGVTDPASIPGRVKERAGTIASKLPNAPSLPSAPSLPNADQLVPGNKGVKDVAPDIVEGSSDKIKLKEKPRFGAYGGDGFNRKNVDLTSAPTLQFVGLNTKGTPLDPATVKDDAIGGVTDPASIPGRVKDRAETIASKLPNAPSLPKLPNAGDVLPGKKDLKDVAPDLVEGSSDKIQQRGRPSFGQYGDANRTNVDFTSAPTLQFVGLDTKGTPLDPATVKDDAIGGVTDPASIPGRVKERAGTIASKLPNAPSLPNAGDVLPGKKDLKDVAPDLVEGSSDKIQQRGRPSFGQYGGANRTNVDFTFAPTLQFVGLNTKGTPADPATVKDDVVGGVTDPASIPGRVKDRAQTIASKLPSLPKFGSPDTKGTPADPETVKDDAIGGVTNPASIPGRVKERAGTIASKLPNAPSVPSGSPDTKGTPADPQTVKDDAIGGITDPASIPGRVKERAETIASKLPNLPSFGSPDTKGTPADPETVKDDAIGGITDPASIPGRIKERAGTIASKLPNAPSLPSVDQVLPGDKGIKDVAPDLVEGSSEKIPQRSAPSYGTQNAETGRTNVTFSSTPSLQFVGIDTKGTPADPATVKDDLVGGVTDPASIPGRIKERANTIASKLPDLPSLPNADKAVPGNKGVKDLAPDLVEGSSEKLPQRSAASN